MSGIEIEYKWNSSPINHGPVLTKNYEDILYGTMYDGTQVFIAKGNYFTVFYNEVRRVLGFNSHSSHYWGNLIFIPTQGQKIIKINHGHNLSDDDRYKIASLYAFRSLIGDGSPSKSYIIKINDIYYDITMCTKNDTNKLDLSKRQTSYIKHNTIETIIYDTIMNKYGKKDTINIIISKINTKISEIINGIINMENLDIKYKLKESQEYIRDNIYDILNQ